MTRCLSVLFCLLLPFFAAAQDDTQAQSLRERALGGDISAQYQLATNYFYGENGMRVNRELAAYWYRKAADAGNALAQFNFGICLERGFGIPSNPALALQYYEMAGKQGVLAADYNRALLLLFGVKGRLERDSLKPDEPKAVQILKDLSQENFAPAMVELAAYYLHDPNVSMELQIESVHLLTDACKQPDVPPRGLRLLADCYYGSIGALKQDIPETIRLLERAIEKNDTESMAKYAFLLENGIIPGKEEENCKKAFELYRTAAEAGLPMAQYKYAEYLADGYVEGKGLDDAMPWYRKAAAANCPQAIHRLALFSLQGIEMDNPDKTRAAEMFFIAAKAGYAPSQYNLAIMLMDGDGVPQNQHQAYLLLLTAARSGHIPAMRRLARAFMLGEGCIKSEEQALQWLKKAADAGDYTANEILNGNQQLFR